MLEWNLYYAVVQLSNVVIPVWHVNLPVCNGINGIDSALLRFYYNFNQRVKVIFKTLGIGNTLLVPNLVKPSQTCGFSFPFCGVFLHISQPHRKGIFAYFATPQKGTQKECFSTIPPRSRAVKEPGHGSQPGPISFTAWISLMYSFSQELPPHYTFAIYALLICTFSVLHHICNITPLVQKNYMYVTQRHQRLKLCYCALLYYIKVKV